MANENNRILIVGTGFAGLGMGIKLKEAGIHDFTILEQADDVGGTWRDNTYPGAACDVQSHVYSFSFEPNPTWSRMFAGHAEIFHYLRHCAEKYGLLPHIQFKSRVVESRYDEATGLWAVKTDDGKTRTARVLVVGCGALSRYSLPDIPGLGEYQGKIFHTASWDHAFSLTGKRVAVIGTGASAIQVVPAIIDRVGSLALYQRTAPWVLPKPDFAMPEAAKMLFERVPLAQKLLRLAIYWGLEARAVGFVMEPRLLALAQTMGTRHLAKTVADPVLRAKLTPNFVMGCKRVLMSNEYYQALQRPHAEVVTERIDHVNAQGIVTVDGKAREADAIVLATGFTVAESAAPFPIYGRAGEELNEVWRDGAEAYVGTTVNGFPNYFMLVGPNTGLGHNSMVHIIESQLAYVVDAIETMRAKSLASVEVKPADQNRYNERIGRRLERTVWNTGGCVSWYRTSSGKNTTLWPGFTWEYRLRTRKFDPPAYTVQTLEELARIASEGARSPLVTGRHADPPAAVDTRESAASSAAE